MNKILKELISQEKWKNFWNTSKDFIFLSPSGKIDSLPKDFALMPGSFNPLHEGHKRLAEVMEQLVGQPVIFELSITNVDKPWLDEKVVLNRLEQFINYKPLVISRAATFGEKAKIFGGCNYVLGYDTALRVLSSKYYDSKEAMINKLNNITKHGGKFWVAARIQDNELKTLNDLIIPKDLQPFFLEIPEKLFRVDISSTLLRSQRKIL